MIVLSCLFLPVQHLGVNVLGKCYSNKVLLLLLIVKNNNNTLETTQDTQAINKILPNNHPQTPE